MNQLWVVRAGRDSAFIDDFIGNRMVAIGWSELGDLSAVQDRETIAEMVRKAYPDFSRPQQIVSSGQVYRFRHDLIVGKTVLTYDSGRRIYHVGQVIGEYEYHPELDPELRHVKAVKWEREIPRDDLSPETKRSLGAIATIFCISEAASEEVTALFNGGRPLTQADEIVTSELDNSEAQIRQNIEQSALEFVQDRIAKLSWSEMQELVAGLLRAMGYKTRVAPVGPDRGRDIVASPDGFGFQTPRIIVEVKHRMDATGSQQLRSFLAGLRNGDSGLYVSTSGFTREARYEAERANHYIALMELSELAKEVVDHYDNMDTQTRTLLPLKKIFWPA